MKMSGKVQSKARGKLALKLIAKKTRNKEVKSTTKVKSVQKSNEYVDKKIDSNPVSKSKELIQKMTVDQLLGEIGNLAESSSKIEKIDEHGEKKGAGLKKENGEKKKKKNSMAMHKKQLEELEKTDPEFHKFLKENDQSLLEFENEDEQSDDESELSLKDEDSSGSNHSDGDSESDSEPEFDREDDLEDEDAVDATKEVKKATEKDVTIEMVKELEKLLTSSVVNKNNLSIKRAVTIFRAGVDVITLQNGRKRKSSKEDDEGNEIADDEEMESARVLQSKSIVFSNEKVLRRFMTISYVHIANAFDTVLGKGTGKAEKNEKKKKQDEKEQKQLSFLDESTQNMRWNPSKSVLWSKLEALFKAFALEIIRYLSTVQDARIKRSLLRTCMQLLPYCKTLHKLGFRMIKSICSIWSNPTVSDATRMRAYVLLRSLADMNESQFTDRVIRSMYKGYLSSNLASSSAQSRVLSVVIFCCRCLVDVLGLNLGVSYSLAFIYIRELAVRIRSALTHPSIKKKNKNSDNAHDAKASASASRAAGNTGNADESLNKVFSWSHINALRVWALVLGQYNAESELRPLIYPFTQVSLATIQLCHGAKTAGVRFQVILMLSQLERDANVYIPLALPSCALLNHVVQIKPSVNPKLSGKKRKQPGAIGASTQEIDWRFVLRVADSDLNSSHFGNAVIRRTLLCLGSHLSSNSRSPAFPELSLYAMQALRRYLKETRDGNTREPVRNFVRLVEQHSQLIVNARRISSATPKSFFESKSNRLSDEQLKTVLHSAQTVLPIERWYEIETDKIRKDDMLRDNLDSDINSTPIVEQLQAFKLPRKQKKSKSNDQTEESVSVRDELKELNERELENVDDDEGSDVVDDLELSGSEQDE